MIILKKENIDKFGKDYIRNIIRELVAAGKENSGKLINSFSDEIKGDAEQMNILISSEDYLKFVDEGRRPGTYPPLSAIKEWATLKGIDDKLVWPIAHNIFKFGIDPTNVLNQSESSFFSSSDFNDFENSIVRNLEEEIEKEIEWDVDAEI